MYEKILDQLNEAKKNVSKCLFDKDSEAAFTALTNISNAIAKIDTLVEKERVEEQSVVDQYTTKRLEDMQLEALAAYAREYRDGTR